MSIIKRGKWYWMDAVINGHRYRESLNTTDKRLAPGLERERVAQLKDKAPDPTRGSRAFSNMTVADAVDAYITERSVQVSARMVGYWREQSRPLIRSKAFRSLKLSKITPANLAVYQAERRMAGRAPKTINGELSVLRQLLRHARLWFLFREDYKPLTNTKPPAGRALTAAETDSLFKIAKTRPDWTYAYTAATMSFFCGMRACEIKSLQWKDVDFENRLIHIRRSKTPAGWRTPSLNETCLNALRKLYQLASCLGATDTEHYVFPRHGKEQLIDPTKPMTSWRSAWRSIRKAAGLTTVRFHDGRHTAITIMAEKGLADWVIQAQVGHIDPQMMKTYSHIRRKALEEAAAALEPSSGQPTSTSTLQENAPLIG
jgi:integrase